MDYEEIILHKLEAIEKIEKMQLEVMQSLLAVFSKYDSQYMTEMEGEGVNLIPEDSKH